jgi:hypothetical protein
MGNPVRSSSELQRQATELVEQQAAISQVLRAVCELASRLAANLRHDPHQCHAPLPSQVRRVAPLRGKRLSDVCAKRSTESGLCRAVAVRARKSGRPRRSPRQLIESGSPVHIADLAADQAYLRRNPRVVALVELAEVRTYLLVPLRKDDELASFCRETPEFVSRRVTSPIKPGQTDV